MYWLNRDGVSISGTNKNFDHYDLIEQNDIERAVKTQKSFVAGTKERHNRNLNHFSIFAPILDQERKVRGFLLAHIRLDHLERLYSHTLLLFTK